MSFVANLETVSSPTMRRILASGRQPWFDRAQFEKAREFFVAHPESHEALCFFDGHIEDTGAYLRRTRHSNPYIASVVAMGRDGIPLPIGRRATELWSWE